MLIIPYSSADTTSELNQKSRLISLQLTCTIISTAHTPIRAQHLGMFIYHNLVLY